MAPLPRVVLQIGAPDAQKNAYPLRYFSEELGGAKWATDALAEEWIPVDLPDTTNAGLTPAKVRSQLERAAGAQVLRELGDYLAGLVDRGDVGKQWRTRRQQSRGPAGKKFATILHAEPKEVRALPWELLRLDKRRLFSDVENPVYRGITSANPVPAETLPLRVLVVVGATDADRQTIQWDAELEALRRKFHRNATVELEELIRPDATEFVKFVKKFRPHVFHFAGHGEMANGEPALILWDKAQQIQREWTADLMLQDFTTARWMPHLLFFNACRSATAQESSVELARLLVEGGACCVIGMQGDVLGAASAAFAESVYTEILNGSSIDVAVANARVVMSPQQDTRDWALPALYLACTPDDAMPKTFAVDEAPLLLDFTNTFAELSDFIDRRDERRDICSLILEPQQGLQQKGLIIVHGASEIGKSDLVRWCSRHLSLRGRNVHYVDLQKNGGETRTILRAIRFGNSKATGTVLGPLPAAAFEIFDRRLKAIDDGRPETADDPIGQLCRSFVDGLRTLGAQGELVIILDHFELKTAGVDGTVDPTDFASHLKPLLFDVVAAKQIAGVRILLVMRDEELRRNEGAQLRGQAVELPAVPAWAREEFEWLARQLVIDALGTQRRPEIEQFVTAFKTGHITGPWGPKKLRQFGRLIETYMENMP